MCPGAHTPRLSEWRRAAAASLFALAAVGLAGEAVAVDDPTQVVAAAKRIPALRTLPLTALAADQKIAGVYTGKLGTRPVEVLGARQKGGGPMWVVTMGSGAKRARELIAVEVGSTGGGGGALAQLDLVDTVVVFSEHDGEMRIPEIPADLRAQLQRML